jgi:two-component system sensor histidine kinase KdpD
MRWRKYVAAAATVVAVVAALRAGSVETAGIASPLLLLDVVVAARLWGIGPALLASAIASAAYSYYFLPPAGFAIEDPEDWVAFVIFVVTAVVSGELASRAERRAAEAHASRLEVERLYQELRNAFERASEAEAARRNEQVKAALLDAMTHNLRTPLTAIKAAVTALIGVQSSDLPIEGQRELLEVIDEESDRLNRFIEGLSTSEPGELSPPIHLHAVRLDEVVQAAMARAENLTRSHDVKVDLDPHLPLVAVDRAAMVEVIYMLIDNASKYSPEGSQISIRASRADDREVRVAVTDDGPGIPLDLRERVFEKFFRVPARQAYDPRRGGIGLGLPIARRLVEAQAGRIWIDEAENAHGTTVMISLPIAVDQPDRDTELLATQAAS